MKKSYILLFFTVAGGAVFVADNTYRAEEQQYFILHYTPGPAWDFEKAPNQQERFSEHSRFLSSLRESGRAKIGGRYSDKGMIILTARDRAQADSLLATDLSVVNETFKAEMHPIQFFYHGTIVPKSELEND